jgi:hypothetical protein
MRRAVSDWVCRASRVRTVPVRSSPAVTCSGSGDGVRGGRAWRTVPARSNQAPGRQRGARAQPVNHAINQGTDTNPCRGRVNGAAPVPGWPAYPDAFGRTSGSSGGTSRCPGRSGRNRLEPRLRAGNVPLIWDPVPPSRSACGQPCWFAIRALAGLGEDLVYRKRAFVYRPQLHLRTFCCCADARWRNYDLDVWQPGHDYPSAWPSGTDLQAWACGGLARLTGGHG